VSLLLRHLPPHKPYKIIFMRRDMAEVLASQKIMLQRRGKDTSGDDLQMSQSFARHLDDITAWLDAQPHMDVIYINYSAVMTQPLTSAETIKRFLGKHLDAHKMASVVDPSLYRNRAPRD
jgi:Sulfotransferase domain